LIENRRALDTAHFSDNDKATPNTVIGWSGVLDFRIRIIMITLWSEWLKIFFIPHQGSLWCGFFIAVEIWGVYSAILAIYLNKVISYRQIGINSGLFDYNDWVIVYAFTVYALCRSQDWCFSTFKNQSFTMTKLKHIWNSAARQRGDIISIFKVSTNFHSGWNRQTDGRTGPFHALRHS